MLAKFGSGNVDGASKRSTALNLEISRMTTGAELQLGPSGSNVEGRKSMAMASPNAVRASMHARIHGSPRGVNMPDASPRSGALRKLASPTAVGAAKRATIAVTSPKGLRSDMSARKSPK